MTNSKKIKKCRKTYILCKSYYHCIKLWILKLINSNPVSPLSNAYFNNLWRCLLLEIFLPKHKFRFKSVWVTALKTGLGLLLMDALRSFKIKLGLDF